MILILSLLGLTVAVVGAYAPLVWTEKGRRSFILALRSLWLHKLRSFLSVLGIIIGTMSVVTLMGFGEGSMQDALEEIRKLGATNVIVKSVKPPDDSSTARRTQVAIYGLTYDDYDRFATLSTMTRRVPMRIFPQEIRNLQYMFNGRVVGTTPEYAQVNTLQLASGRFLIEEDDHLMDNVAVIGSAVADKLFAYGDPLGQTVRLGNYFYRIVGVLKDRTPIGGSANRAAENFNGDVYIPLQTCKVRFGEKIMIRQSGSRSGEQVQLNQVTLTLANMTDVRPAGEVVKDLLERYHTKNDWVVEVPLDKLEEAEATQARYLGLLLMIAMISLTVGGIGIMNIMLATVTERTREIGIRRALGAKRRDITLQFLTEAVVQTSVGGIAGVLFGLAALFLIPFLWSLVGWHLPAQVNVLSIFIGLAVSVGVGVAFGYYPAWKAARLDPIEALRHV